MQIILKKNEEERILKGHPWIFANEVDVIKGDVISGEICEVYSSTNEFIGVGFFNINSKIIVRMLSKQRVSIDESFWYERIKQAWEYRKVIGKSEAGRIIFSEADLIPGLIVDKYSDYLVVQILSLGIEKRKKLFIKLLVEIINPRGIYERSDVSVRKKEGLDESTGLLYGECPKQVTIKENGIMLNVDIYEGQKTGYFLDQAQNRDELKHYVKDKMVLDCFAHTGGFSLHAAKYNAKAITSVDISQKACDDIMNNAKLNGFDNIDVRCDDVFNFLRLKENDQKYDVIILDPPAFTKSKDTINKAYKGYKDINLQALKIIKSNGFLLTFSCSQHMTPDLFLEMIKDAAIDSKRTVQMIDFRIQSYDHPMLITGDESFYLKCVILHVL